MTKHYIIYDSYGDKIGYADNIADAEDIKGKYKNGKIAKISRIKQVNLPKASKKKFIINDLRYRKYVSIN